MESKGEPVQYTKHMLTHLYVQVVNSNQPQDYINYVGKYWEEKNSRKSKTRKD